LFPDLFRQAATTGTDNGIDLSQPLVQYGAVGVLATAAMFWAWTLYKQAQDNMKRERDRADRLEAEIAKLNADIHGKYIPVLTRVTDVLQDFLWNARDDGRGHHPSGRGRT
jgi:hypothetical protein